jgi:hypothetical protein
MSTLSQRSFTGGELSPSLHARVDFAKYQTSAKTMRNFVTQKHGGAANRSGSEFCGEVKDSTKAVRLIPFNAGPGARYAVEFGHQTCRFYKEGSQVLLTAQNITAITNANPCVLTYDGADTYTAGEEVYISGIVGPIGTYLNNRNFKVGTVTAGSNTFVLQYMDGTNVDSTSFGAYTSGGTVAEVYTIASVYNEADLFDIQYSQSVDVMTLTHPSYPIKELVRVSDTS